MPRIYPVEEIISLTNFSHSASKLKSKSKKALLKRLWKESVVANLVGAFLIILVSALVLSFIERQLTQPQFSVSAQVEEKTAFQPGQFVTEKLKIGYYGNYR